MKSQNVSMFKKHRKENSDRNAVMEFLKYSSCEDALNLFLSL